MIVAAGQFVVTPEWENNARTCVALMAKAAALLVLPEALLARSDSDPGLSVASAQPLDGGFLTQLRAESRKNAMTTVLTIHVPSTEGRAVNTLVVLRAGHIIARYAKLHLYDAFSILESSRVDAGSVIPLLIEVAGIKIGLMTCYDLRFPELALSLALQGADLLVLPAAWVRGPLKEHHWATLLAAPHACRRRGRNCRCYAIAAFSPHSYCDVFLNNT